jgi:hypothetical protein
VKNIEEVRKRSNNQCEAMVWVESAEVWSRCGMRGVEVHHALTRGRGGTILDSIGETYHLIALCNRCHEKADGGAAYEGGVLIDGYVSRDGDWIVYDGSDTYLSEKYPRRNS